MHNAFRNEYPSDSTFPAAGVDKKKCVEPAVFLVSETVGSTECFRGSPDGRMFTARVDLDLGRERQFAKALVEMNYDNPDHRPILEAEGLRKWIPPQLDGYQSLREASAAQGLL